MTSENYECQRCGARFGIAGTASADDDADDFYAAEVQWHESGQCSPVEATAPVRPTFEASHITVDIHIGGDIRIDDFSDRLDPFVCIKVGGGVAMYAHDPAQAERVAQAFIDAANLLRPQSDPPVKVQRVPDVPALLDQYHGAPIDVPASIGSAS